MTVRRVTGLSGNDIVAYRLNQTEAEAVRGRVAVAARSE
jgi:hypothetical protein